MSKPSDDSDLVVEGLLVGGDGERLDLVVTPYLLSFERAAVVDLEVLPAPPQLVAGTARAVRLRLRAGVRLHGFSSANDVESKLWARRSSFATVSRSTTSTEETLETEEQRALTRAFLAAHGIDASATEENGTP